MLRVCLNLICRAPLILIFLVANLRAEILYKTLREYPKSTHRVKYIMHKYFIMKGLHWYRNSRERHVTRVHANACCQGT